MLQYLVILLDDTSVSYCHYENPKKERRLILLEHLKEGILFAMKENLMIQFVYPAYELPNNYRTVIDSIDHIDIKPISNSDFSDVMVLDNLTDLARITLYDHITYVLRTDKKSLFKNYVSIKERLPEFNRLNIVITDIDTFTETDFVLYKKMLTYLSNELVPFFLNGKSPQINILTDRILLDKMNNCEAGCENITLAPNGSFYVCPAFYLDQQFSSIGNLDKGLDIKNSQLFKISHAPICRKCDAFQCKRCVYLNKKTTFEVNTPSHEQCVIAHLERNASKELLNNIRKSGTFLPNTEICEIQYLDPFDLIKK